MTLHEVYQAKLPEYQKAISKYLVDNSEEKLANPLLIGDMSVKNFSGGDLKIMFFGQETNNWYNDIELRTDLLQKAYDEFYTTDAGYKHGGQFWNGVKQFKELIKKEFSDKYITFIWNNIIKAGKQSKGRPNNKILEIERTYFNIIPSEIDIIDPNIIIFLTGPNYDDILTNVIPKIKKQSLKEFTDRQLLKFNISNDCIAYRTYHPNYLWRNNINKYFSSIVMDIKQSLTTAG